MKNKSQFAATAASAAVVIALAHCTYQQSILSPSSYYILSSLFFLFLCPHSSQKHRLKTGPNYLIF